MAQVVLRTERIVFSYDGEKNIVFRPFELGRGEMVVLKGPMGCGKTTFAKILAGLEKPAEGRVFFNENDIWKDRKARKEFSGKAVMLFQFSQDQLFEKSVLADVMYGPLNLGMSREEAEKASEEALSLCGVEKSLWDRNPLLLSGGQKKLVSFAGVLAMRSPVLILDEITAALDLVSQKRIFDVLDFLMKERGVSVVLVTHDDISLSCGGVYEIGNDQ
ncbi:MAG: energy-coupling factor ABC transporter ATP-binding protein [Sphaerochaetaceae bacterium]|nr:energy-coupling factor ABC transporter ATP-binding protein [Sphaerochaetaceae bacterium]